jgi:AcrR family transcriptional regulator
MARPPLTAVQRADLDARQRSQILGGLAACIDRKGYGATTIADIAAAARTSKSTVYAHFSDKEAVFLALYSTASDNVLAVIDEADGEARAAGVGWRERLEAIVGAYLATMAGGAALTRCLLIEVQAVSPRALRLRRDVLDRYVRLFARITREIARGRPELRAPSPALLLGALGGINEHMLRAVEDGPPRLRGVTADATDLLERTLQRKDP